MKSKKNKQKLLRELKKNPVIRVACQRADIGHATYYRWRKECEEFKELSDKAFEEGRNTINDIAESQIIKYVAKGNIPAIKYWLRHNHPRYYTVYEKTQQITQTSGVLPYFDQLKAWREEARKQKQDKRIKNSKKKKKD